MTRINTQYKSTQPARRPKPRWVQLLLVLGISVFLCETALAQKSFPRPRANDSTALYEELVTDMEIKYLGGTIVLNRQWANGRWNFNPDWSDLQFFREKNVLSFSRVSNPSSGSAGSRAREVGVSGKLGSGIEGNISGSGNSRAIKAIARNVFEYEPVDDEGQVYRYLKNKTITRTETGYRWAYARGDWIGYTLEGRALRYGNRNCSVPFSRRSLCQIIHRRIC